MPNNGVGSRRREKSKADVSLIEEVTFDLADMITLPDAVRLIEAQGLDFSREAVKRWISRYKIGRKVGGRWYVDPEKLALLLGGKVGHR